MIHHFPDLVQIHHGALGKVTDCEKMKEEGRIDVSGAYQSHATYSMFVVRFKV